LKSLCDKEKIPLKPSQEKEWRSRAGGGIKIAIKIIMKTKLWQIKKRAALKWHRNREEKENRSEGNRKPIKSWPKGKSCAEKLPPKTKRSSQGEINNNNGRRKKRLKKRRLLLALEQQQQQHRAASPSLFHSFKPHCKKM